MNKEMQNILAGSSRYMDDQLSGMYCSLDILNAVQEKIAILSEDMDSKKDKDPGTVYAYMREYNRDLKILSDLMYHKMKELNVSFKNAHDKHLLTFDLIHEKNKECISSN